MAEKILLRSLPWPDLELLRDVARAGSNNPRTIGGILAALRDLCLVNGPYDLDEALTWLGLSEDGLTATAREYLRVLLTEFGGQAGERAMVDRLQKPGGLGHTERNLMDKGYIAKRKTGRVLTAGFLRVGERNTVAVFGLPMKHRTTVARPA